MTRSALHTLVVTAMALLVAGSAGAEVASRAYPLHTLESTYAASLILDLCDAAKGEEPCEIQVLESGGVQVLAPSEVHARIIRMLVERDPAVPPTLTFTVYLVEASREPAALPEGVTPAVKKALEGVREVLGYQSFRIADRTLIRTSRAASTMIQTPGGWRCQVDLEIRSIKAAADGTHLTVSFDVRRGGLGPDQRSIEHLVASTFSLVPGEVAVAGTSRLTQGDASLLFLVSSAPLGAP